MTVTGGPHTITMTIAHSHGIEHKFTCTAPEGAPCRLVCPDGCEEFDLTDHVVDIIGNEDEMLPLSITAEERAELTRRHTLVDNGECNALVFLENDDAELWELYDGEPAPLRTGPVVLSYADGYVTWKYAAAVPDHAVDNASRWDDPTDDAGAEHHDDGEPTDARQDAMVADESR